MGRELKRVALTFVWPLSKRWDGYLNPHSPVTCPECGGDGSSPTARGLKMLWYGYVPFRPEDRGSEPHPPTHPNIVAFARRNVESAPGYYGRGVAALEREQRRLAALWNEGWQHHLNADDVAALLAADRLWDLTRSWSREEGWKTLEPPRVPTPQEVNDWSLGGMGHDSINSWVCIRAECAALGALPTCETCEGEGCLWPDPAIKAASDAWEPTEPPAGEGYQMWETVSEGSPISPVFEEPEGLASWLSRNRLGTVDEGTTFGQWMAFIAGPGWAPSLVVGPGGVKTGVEASVARDL